MLGPRSIELRKAIDEGDEHKFEVLVLNEKSSINLIDDKGQTALHHVIAYAVKPGSKKEVVKKMFIRLLKDGADLSIKNQPQKQTPLEMAFVLDCLDFFIELFNKEPNLFSDDAHSVMDALKKSKQIFEAVVLGDLATLQDLDNPNFKIYDPRNHGTPLHWVAGKRILAVGNKKVDIATLLLDQCPSLLDEQDTEEWTALHCAVKSQNIQLVQLLIERGAKLDIKNKDGETAVTLALKLPNEEIRTMLLSALQSSVEEKIAGSNEPSAPPLKYGEVVPEEKTEPKKRSSGLFAKINILSAAKAEIETAHELRDAVQKGNFSKVKQLIVEHISNPQYINLQGTKGYTALHWAIDYLSKQRKESKNEETALQIISFLIKFGADLSVKDENQKTALDLAGELDCFDVFSVLFEENCLNQQQIKVFLDQKTKIDNIDALCVAVAQNKIEKVAELLKIIGGPNVFNKQGRTPLHIAVEKGHKKLCQFLLDSGADVEAKTKLSENRPIHLAASGNHLQIAQLLIDWKAKTSVSNRNGNTPSMLALANNHIRMFNLLHGEKLEKHETLITEMRQAVESGNLKKVKALHLQGVNINSLLNLAFVRDHLEVAEYLIRAGANVNEKDGEDWTPLHYAAKSGRSDLCELLIKKGAHVNAITSKKMTPLHLAALNDHLLVASLLIEKKADPSAKNDKQQMPEDVAKSNELREILSFARKKPLKKAFGFIETPEVISSVILQKQLIEYVMSGNLDKVKEIIESGGDVNTTDEKHKRPILSIAIGQQHVEIAKYLMSYSDIDVNAADNKGDTPLHWAAERQNEDLCLALIALGAKIGAENNDGKKPVDIAKGALKNRLMRETQEAEEKSNAQKEAEDLLPLPDYLSPSPPAYFIHDEVERLLAEEKDASFLGDGLDVHTPEGSEPLDSPPTPTTPNSAAPPTPKMNDEENIDEVPVPEQPAFGPFGLFACIPVIPCGPKQDAKKSFAVISVQPVAQQFSLWNSMSSFVSDAIGNEVPVDKNNLKKE